MLLPLKAIALSAALTAAMSSVSSGQSDKDFYFGLAALARKNQAEAIRLFTKVVERNPNDADAFMLRGVCYQEVGELEKAITDHNEAIRLDPKNDMFYTARGAAWLAKGEFDKAVADCEEAIRLDPQSVDALNKRAWIRATCWDENYRDGAKAIEEAIKACETTEWKSPDYLDTLAAAYAESGEFDKAVGWQEKATDLAPESEKADFGTRLKLYQEGKPYREKPGKK